MKGAEFLSQCCNFVQYDILEIKNKKLLGQCFYKLSTVSIIIAVKSPRIVVLKYIEMVGTG